MGTIADDMIDHMFDDFDDPYGDDDDHEPVVFSNCRCIKETDRALLVNFDKWGFKQHWIPKSVAYSSSDVLFEGAEGKLVIPQWFCRENGIK